MTDSPHVRSCGEESVLLEVPADRVLATYDAVRALVAEGRVGARDVVPGARTVLVDGLRGLDADGLLAAVAQASGTDRDAAGMTVELPTRYDGQDLEDVARRWDMTVAEVVATHSGTLFTVAFCGFAPGFAYCTGLDERLHVPRHETPRSRVPSGSVGLAGEFTGVYPTASPGGWRLLGRTDARLWDSESDPPATLAPGTRVRFVDAGDGA